MVDHPPPDTDDKDDKEASAATIPVALSPPLQVNPLQVDNWTDYIPTTDHVEFFRSREWGKTPMGELKTWSFALRLHVFMVLADSRAACLYWFVLPSLPFPSLAFALAISLSEVQGLICQQSIFARLVDFPKQVT